MQDVTASGPMLSVLLVGGVLAAGVLALTLVDAALSAAISGRGSWRSVAGETFGRAVLVWQQRGTVTERPDVTLWLLAPGFYGACAVAAVAVVPVAEGIAAADVRTGIVVFGAVEVLTMVAVYLHGWSANSYLSLIGGYRFVAVVLSTLLISMFVLIGAALPAESLSFGAIVDSQTTLWNVVRQPLGLPLWLAVGLATAFWGPFQLADAADLAGGTSAETSGPHRLAWAAARRAMLVAYAVAGAAVFLGGHHGPWLPGWLWMAVKSIGVLTLLLALGHLVGRWRPERVVTVAWTVLLPASFVHLVVAGSVALLASGG
ncbi:MAG: NADH-quinone oxidoreductase subunit H [Actinomycetota bacterium]|nr:NADH-quinone oxidoreductase subunit H [Actinomycetota bacterium]